MLLSSMALQYQLRGVWYIIARAIITVARFELNVSGIISVLSANLSCFELCTLQCFLFHP